MTGSKKSFIEILKNEVHAAERWAVRTTCDAAGGEFFEDIEELGAGSCRQTGDDVDLRWRWRRRNLRRDLAGNVNGMNINIYI